MTATVPDNAKSRHGRAVAAFGNPYLLLALTSLFWSGNHIVGRAAGGVVPPLALSTLRWFIPTLLLWIIARRHIVRDWPTIRTHWKILLWFGFTGGVLFTSLQYVGLQYTSALNVSVLNSLVPVLILGTGALIFRDRVTPLQLTGILVSSVGVIVIIAHGDLATLRDLAFNWGDLIIVFNMAVFSIYATYLRLRPPIHPLSLLFMLGALSAIGTLPFAVAESLAGYTLKLNWMTVGVVAYVAIFPSLLAYAAWNRGVELIGANRAGPFLHLIPVYTAVLGYTLLGEHLYAFHVLGFVLILGGVYLASRKGKSTAAEA
ncbi:MAG: DMT family transporter [Proteobacteria bacterium]|nr:DMT family transporter [Pseudomonadota bacterium]